MDIHEAQAGWDALAAGDPGPVFEALAEDVVVDNGPGAGPWRHVEGRENLASVLLHLAGHFAGDWTQTGTVIYADDAMTVTLVRETGTAAETGDQFDNLAVYVARLGPDNKVNRLWTVDLAHESLEDFWARNPASALS
jgi:ketosteroid isomerase-like protein